MLCKEGRRRKMTKKKKILCPLLRLSFLSAVVETNLSLATKCLVGHMLFLSTSVMMAAGWGRGWGVN